MDKPITVCVMTKNEFLFQKIRAELTGAAECILCESGTPRKDADAVIRCTDEFPDASSGDITMSRYGDADIALPFRIGTLRERFTNEGKRLTIIPSEKCVRLCGRLVRLTDVELALLTALVSRSGAFISREELLHEVWDDSTDSGVVNVYVHYLREKLESDGEKIILCSRNHGYRIDEKYIGGDED